MMKQRHHIHANCQASQARQSSVDTDSLSSPEKEQARLMRKRHNNIMVLLRLFFNDGSCISSAIGFTKRIPSSSFSTSSCIGKIVTLIAVSIIIFISNQSFFGIGRGRHRRSTKGGIHNLSHIGYRHRPKIIHVTSAALNDVNDWNDHYNNRDSHSHSHSHSRKHDRKHHRKHHRHNDDDRHHQDNLSNWKYDKLRYRRRSSSLRGDVMHVHRVHKMYSSQRHRHRDRHRGRGRDQDAVEFWELSGNRLQSRNHRNNNNQRLNDDSNDNNSDNEDYHEIYQPYKNNPECKPMHKWQTKSYPTCNVIHEQPLNVFNKYYKTKFLAEGWWRMTFRTLNEGEPIAYKTMRMDRIFGNFVLNKHRIDAIIYDRMTRSRHIMDIYGYCAFSGLFEYANGGYNLENYLFEMEEGASLNKIDRLKLALDVTEGLADLHSIDSVNGHSAMVHSDVIVNQYVMTESGFKLNDFNRGHLMYWNTTSNTSSCPYKCNEPNPGVQRAPEEIFYSNEQTEKIDIFSLGHILFMILTNEESFDESKIDMEEVQEIVKKGGRPKYSTTFLESDHPVDRAIMKAIDMCFVQDWRKRHSSVEVRDYLALQLSDINV